MAEINQRTYVAVNYYVQVINLNIAFVKFAWTSFKDNITVKVNIECRTQLSITWFKIPKELPEVLFKKLSLKICKIQEKTLVV